MCVYVCVWDGWVGRGVCVCLWVDGWMDVCGGVCVSVSGWVGGRVWGCVCACGWMDVCACVSVYVWDGWDGGEG